MTRSQISTATTSSSVADILERVLDKGVVIAGDIRVKLVDVELLSIQIRLVVCSIDRAKEIGIDWWSKTQSLIAPADVSQTPELSSDLAIRLNDVESRLRAFESALLSE
jgi:hypothetical protein